MEKSFKGISIPTPGFGSYQIHDPAIIKKAIDVGFRHIDTAISYNNEKQVGEGWKMSGVNRQDLFITTKIPPGQLKHAQIMRSIDESLVKLKTDYVDLLLIHWPSDEGVPVEESLGAFEEIRKAGKTRSIGISNFNTELMRKSMQIAEIVCNQVEYHPFSQPHEVKELCDRENICLTAYTPIAKNKVEDNSTIRAIAEKYKKTPAQITLRWLIQQKSVVPIPRSSREEHIRDNFDVFDFELNEDEMNRMFQLG